MEPHNASPNSLSYPWNLSRISIQEDETLPQFLDNSFNIIQPRNQEANQMNHIGVEPGDEEVTQMNHINVQPDDQEVTLINNVNVQPDIQEVTLINNISVEPQNEEVINQINETGVTNEAGIPKRRGRPRGAKNKGKAPVHETSNMNEEIHEIPPGTDIINWVTQYVQSQYVCVTVLSASGEIALVDITYGDSNSSSQTISGPFTLTSFSGLCLLFSLSPGAGRFFNVSFKTPSGQVYGGEVTGRMVASSTVTLMISTFSNPKFYELRSTN